MPGFIHLQAAQPPPLATTSWPDQMPRRDRDRLLDCRKRLNQLPLEQQRCREPTQFRSRLGRRIAGFARVCENSLDAVSDRDFAIEFCAVTALSLTHMSRWCEEMVLWSSQQFNFIACQIAFVPARASPRRRTGYSGNSYEAKREENAI